jgi:hypothetical protein
MICTADILNDSSFLLVWLWIWLYCMTLFSKAIFISSLFTKAKMGIIAGISWFFVESVVHDLCFANKSIFSPGLQFGIALFDPFLATSFSGDVMLALDAGGIGANFGNIDFTYKNFKV